MAKRVLIAVDSNNPSPMFEFYAKNLHRKEHDVIVVHVAVPMHVILMSDGIVGAGDVCPQTGLDEQCRVTELERLFKALLTEHEIRGRVCIVLDYKIGAAIVEAARGERAELMVIGARAGCFCSSLRCTVRDYVCRNAPCPVIACRR